MKSKVSLVEVFAKNVRHFRILRNTTQEELANKSGLHRTYIGDIECERRNVSINNIEKIAIALEVSPNMLLEIIKEINYGK
ncbi:MAG: helix-turn-helix domain-containing protein [Bifidobacteriaceae bacterium]|jgi:transcriptional regulator with XRE-family HTH domain|nr:helix-turn-helix domain-containing protein [Bifidobacteriaceae bacterium]